MISIIITGKSRLGGYFLRRRVMIIVLIVAIFAAAFLLVSLFLAAYVMTGRRQTLEETFKWQTDHYDTSFLEKLSKNEYIVEGCDGYQLHVILLKNPKKTDKYMIITHGYTDNRNGALKYASLYLDLGYNCIIYDLRGHGLNKPYFTTYGILEARDLDLLIKDSRKRYHISELGLHGESLGAATTVTVLKYKPDIDFAVSDCGFSDIWNVLRGGVKRMHLPGFIVNMADLGAIIRYHYSFKKMRPIDSLDENELPLLFIHGDSDTFILPKNSLDMAERTRGYHETGFIKGAGHAMSIIKDPENYRKYVNEFLNHLREKGYIKS